MHLRQPHQPTVMDTQHDHAATTGASASVDPMDAASHAGPKTQRCCAFYVVPVRALRTT